MESLADSPQRRKNTQRDMKKIKYSKIFFFRAIFSINLIMIIMTHGQWANVCPHTCLTATLKFSTSSHLGEVRHSLGRNTVKTFAAICFLRSINQVKFSSKHLPLYHQSLQNSYTLVGDARWTQLEHQSAIGILT